MVFSNLNFQILPGEEWRPIWAEGYAVSNLGRIATNRTCPTTRQWRLRRPSAHVQGYKLVKMLDSSRRVSSFLVHRLVLEAFVGPCPPGMEARHLDGNPANNVLRNLAWGTKSENELDKVRQGRRGPGRVSKRAL